MPNFNETISNSGVLDGISWRKYDTNPNYAEAASYPELHIGRVRNFEIHLQKNPDNANAGGDYSMELWELSVIPTHQAKNDGDFTDICTITPQYSILMTNTPINAASLDDAKIQAVSAVLNYIGNEYTAATQRYESMLGIFGDLDQILAEKTARRRAADPIETLGLSNRALLNLQRADIMLIGELVALDVKSVKNLPGIGDDALNNILIRLHKAKMRLAGETTESIAMHELQMVQNAEKVLNERAQQEAAAMGIPTAPDTETPVDNNGENTPDDGPNTPDNSETGDQNTDAAVDGQDVQ